MSYLNDKDLNYIWFQDTVTDETRIGKDPDKSTCFPLKKIQCRWFSLPPISSQTKMYLTGRVKYLKAENFHTQESYLTEI